MYKRFIPLILSLLPLLPVNLYSQRVMNHAMARQSVSAWADKSFARGTVPPFSFDYDGRHSSQFIGKWKFKASAKTAGEGFYACSYTWTDPATGLQVECRTRAFSDFNAVEWVLYMRNTSDKDTPKISDPRTADLSCSTSAKGSYQVVYHDGARNSGHDFAPQLRDLAVGDTLTLYPHGGRSSSWCMPYFNMLVPGGGVMCAVGWTGDWLTVFERTAPGALSCRSGLGCFDAVLHPGEEIRLPSVVVFPWEGTDRMEAQNAFRRLILAHYYPRVHGERVTAPLMNNFANNDDPWPCDEYTCSTDFYDIAIVRKQQLFGVTVDGYWLDAGWYSRAFNAQDGYWWHSSVGNWTPDPVRYPDGIAPVSDAVHATGGKMMLWYEPERANIDSAWAHEHPEYMLSFDGSPAVPVEEVVDSAFIVNLGDPVARKWLTDYMVQHLSDSKVDIYRQDFNIDPQPYWRASDAPDRKGMTEVLYINGLYAYLDSLRARLPHLIIDNCAGGGRRLDIEMYRRSIPMWRHDHETTWEDHQCITYNLSQWLPVHGTATSYGARNHYLSTLSACTVFCWGDTGRASIPQQKHMINCFREYSPYYYEDFYPLTGYEDLNCEDKWLSYQLHRPSDDSGIVLNYMRKNCADSTYSAILHGLDPAATYKVQEVEYENSRRGQIYIRTLWGIVGTEENDRLPEPEPFTLTGEELMTRGFQIVVPSGKACPKMYKYTRYE